MPAPEERAILLDRLGLEAGAFILATFHRPENVDDADRLGTLLEHLAAPRLAGLFSGAPADAQAHRGAASRQARDGVDDGAAALATRTFLGLAAECAFLISDSGGVQEEASVVKRPVIVVRRSTERPEVLGTFATLVPSLGRLSRRGAPTPRRPRRDPSPLGGYPQSLRGRSGLGAVRASHRDGMPSHARVGGWTVAHQTAASLFRLRAHAWRASRAWSTAVHRLLKWVRLRGRSDVSRSTSAAARVEVVPRRPGRAGRARLVRRYSAQAAQAPLWPPAEGLPVAGTEAKEVDDVGQAAMVRRDQIGEDDACRRATSMSRHRPSHAHSSVGGHVLQPRC